ncbi:FAD-dependent oxidoreductase [Actinomadura sp. KC345]|uniref:NAD(P)-binding domain-containing protein n=1 Tax=Actinomadura sp. KC345 TaxID=2530371 RepID=UPI0010457927|nr:NAD(P)-binding domain-containing protein [Actinomadura sp. KC345]TDC56221.1 FAD-dependent oxidoreductase [Actinomadura sp. KC345]
MRSVDVLVIGAGQAGLSAAYHLQRRGFVPVTRASGVDRTFVVLDAEDAAGGAWRHRWASLKMATVNGIYELPGLPVPPADPDAASRDVLPAYFADYEQRFALDVQRPVNVTAVRRATTADEMDDALIVETDSETWSAGHIINATGTWTRPYWPNYPGMQSFRGRQLHVHDYVSAEEFAGKRVVIVGAGISATQLLEEISRVADTLWVTRTEPEWKDGLATPTIVEALARAEERVREGLPPQSIVHVTGMIRTPWTERAGERGVLVRHPMFTSIEEHGVRMPDGSFEPADVILWATGFRAELRHLAPLRLRTRHGGIRVANGRSLDEPRLFVIGYGPSQSTIGANRAGRDAVISILADPAPAEIPAIPA